MKDVFQFLADAKTFFVATADGDQPCVRPQGAVMEYEGKLYFCINNQKRIFQQLQGNPKLEICAVNQSGNWLRIAATAVFDSSKEAKAAMLEAVPTLQNMYKPDDGVMEVFYLKNARATFSSFTAESRVVNF